MKPCIVVLASLVILTIPAATQSACRQAMASVVERHEEFTIYSLSLPSRSGPQVARALIPHAVHPAGASYSHSRHSWELNLSGLWK
jgi:hypothetical protein